MTVRPRVSNADATPAVAEAATADQAGAVLEVLLRGTGSEFLVLTDRRLRITRAGGRIDVPV